MNHTDIITKDVESNEKSKATTNKFAKYRTTKQIKIKDIKTEYMERTDKSNYFLRKNLNLDIEVLKISILSLISFLLRQDRSINDILFES